MVTIRKHPSALILLGIVVVLACIALGNYRAWSAAGDALPIPRKNTAYRLVIPILDADGDPVASAAGLDAETACDGGTWADLSTAEVDNTWSLKGFYTLDLTATEMNCDSVGVILQTSTTGAKTTMVTLYPAENADIPVNATAISGDTAAADNLEAAADGTTYNLGGGAVVAASVTGAVGSVTGAVGSVTGAVGSVTGSVGSVATGGITAASIATDAIGAAEIAADAIGAAEVAADAIGASEVNADVGTEIWSTTTRQLTAVQAFALTGDITGNLSGSVGSVTGAVGSVTGNVGGSVASVTGAVGSVTGDVGGKVLGGGVGTITGTGARVVDASGANVAPASTALTNATWTDARAAYLDAAVSSRSTYAGGAVASVTAGVTLAAGAVDAAAIATGAIDADAIAAAAITSSEAPNLDAAVSTRLASASYTTPPTAADNADAVWDEALAGHAVAGSAGAALSAASAPTAAAVADAVWDELIAGHTVVGSTGAALSAASAPSAATVADAVWDELIAGHAIGGSTGATLSAAGSAGDPWSTAYPGSYTSSQFGGQVPLLAREATFLAQLSPGILASQITVTEDSDLTVTRGDTTALTFSLGTSWPLAGKTVYLTVKASRAAANSTAIINRAATITDAANGVATITLTEAEAATVGVYYYDVTVLTTGPPESAPKTALMGKFSIIQDVRQ